MTLSVRRLVLLVCLVGLVSGGTALVGGVALLLYVDHQLSQDAPVPTPARVRSQPYLPPPPPPAYRPPILDPAPVSRPSFVEQQRQQEQEERLRQIERRQREICEEQQRMLPRSERSYFACMR